MSPHLQCHIGNELEDEGQPRALALPALPPMEVVHEVAHAHLLRLHSVAWKSVIQSIYSGNP